MSKAEERAFEMYPPKLVIYNDLFGEETLDDNGLNRKVFIEGYKQAEKDLELTWNDIALILNMAEEFNRKNTVPISDEEYFKEVLNRFNKQKER